MNVQTSKVGKQARSRKSNPAAAQGAQAIEGQACERPDSKRTDIAITWVDAQGRSAREPSDRTGPRPGWNDGSVETLGGPVALHTPLVAKWKDGELSVGDSVWYRGDRYWVEWLPRSWAEGSFIHISDVRIDPNPDRTPAEKRTLVCVYADLVTRAPVRNHGLTNQPTQAAAARAERAKTGQKDVGDEVATMLRKAKDLEGVYKVGAKFLGTTVAELKAKYGHLNPGQQRMNIGNRMRAKYKKDNQTWAK